jgi:hypothetical protein
MSGYDVRLEIGVKVDGDALDKMQSAFESIAQKNEFARLGKEMAFAGQEIARAAVYGVDLSFVADAWRDELERAAREANEALLNDLTRDFENVPFKMWEASLGVDLLMKADNQIYYGRRIQHRNRRHNTARPRHGARRGVRTKHRRK